MERLDLNGRRSGKMKVFCPLCRERRKDKRDRSVSVDLDKGVAKCHYCGTVFYRPRQPRGGAASGGKPRRGLDTEPTVGASQFTERRGFKDTDNNEDKNNPCLSVQSVSKNNPVATLSEKHIRWFKEERGISRETLERMGVTSEGEWICFNYFENGRLVNTKFRDLEKRFRMTAGAELIPYNIDGIRGTEECIIVEGEIDELSYVEIGRTDVISVPAGANTNLNWMDRFIETHFEDKKVIYIAVDNDRKGLELRKALIGRLGVERCKVIEYPEGCKDANEVLTAELRGVTQSSLVDNDTLCNADNDTLRNSDNSAVKQLKRCLEEAQEIPIEGVFTLRDVSRELRVLFEEGIQPGAKTGWENFDKLCTFELGRLCVVTGVPGSGKSEFVDELVMRLNTLHGWKVGFFSPENMPLTYHLRKLMEKVTGTPFEVGLTPEAEYCRAEKYLQENYSFILPEENFTVEHILDIAKGLVRKQGMKILTIDPFNRFEHLVPPGQTETQYINAVLDLFTNFALRNNCLVILVAHPRKMNKAPGALKEPVPSLYDINGSAAFYNKSDFGIIIDRDDEAKVVEVLIRKVKFKHLGHKGEVRFEYDKRSGRYTEV